MKLSDFNMMSREQAAEHMFHCCGCHAWVSEMLNRRPFASIEALYQAADDIWNSLSEEIWLQALRHHPRIDKLDDVSANEAKAWRGTDSFVNQEHKGVEDAPPEILEAIRMGNKEYEKRFGYIYLVCASGKSAHELLAILQSRLANSPDDEIKQVAIEQGKITKLRLSQLIAAN